VLLLDASVWVALASPEERFHAAADALFDSSHPMVSLDLTLYEVANAVGVKMGARDRARWLSGAILNRCDERLHRVDLELMDFAVEIAAEHGLTAYDAAYVAAARRHGWTLVSADVRDLVSKGLAVAPDGADYP
jgi:predicted nucleic acid-binding protein